MVTGFTVDLDIICVATSERTRTLATGSGLKVVTDGMKVRILASDKERKL